MSTLPLPVDDDGELYRGNVIITQGEGMRDPAYEVEQEEYLTNSLTQTVDEVLALPSCQQRAVICSLKDRIDNVLLLIETFREHQVDIEQVSWPEERTRGRSVGLHLLLLGRNCVPLFIPTFFTKIEHTNRGRQGSRVRLVPLPYSSLLF
jgi:hypothetical protein